ncbi:MAG: thermonuclease family protein [Candidatus Saccharimonadales bacterium]
MIDYVLLTSFILLTALLVFTLIYKGNRLSYIRMGRGVAIKVFAAGAFVTLLLFALSAANIPESGIDLSNSEEEEQPETLLKEYSYYVQRVVDGDTITVTNPEYDGEMAVRLIGIDAPELDSNQCYSQEAADRVEDLLLGENINLIPDNTQDDKDSYDRFLRYVLLDAVDINELLIKEGYAREFTFITPYERQGRYQQAEEAARSADLGLFSAC